MGKLLEGVDIPVTAHQLVEWLMRDLAPRDPLEEMLAVQALLAHTRVVHLTKLSGSQTELKSIQTVNEYADRASNTFRRLMLALAEYRRPPRAGDSFTAIKQANIANQQVVQNEKHGQKARRTNKDCQQTQTPRPYRLTPEGLASLRSSAKREARSNRADGPGKASAMWAWFVHRRQTTSRISCPRRVCRDPTQCGL